MRSLFSIALMGILSNVIGCGDAAMNPKQSSTNAPSMTDVVDKQEQLKDRSESTNPTEPLSTRQPRRDELVQMVITIGGSTSKTGELRIAVYADISSFNKPDQALLKEILKPTESIWKGHVDRAFLKDNRIAIAVFHDSNSNGVLDKNSFGIPTEIYGFSNNPKRGFGPPKFDDVAVRCETEAVQIEIQLQ